MSGEDSGPLLCDPSQKAELEARNGVDQIDYVTEIVARGGEDLRESHVLELHEIAIRGVYACGAKYRDATKDVRIQNSAHVLPSAAFVPAHVRDAIDWINRARGSRSALERAAYALWRFNWIHPFAGGNGRTSRALAYLIVCLDARMMLPGVPSMPALIYERRDDYIKALQAADRSVLPAPGSDNPDPPEPDVSAMSDFLQDVLTMQLASAIDQLSSKKH